MEKKFLDQILKKNKIPDYKNYLFNFSTNIKIGRGLVYGCEKFGFPSQDWDIWNKMEFKNFIFFHPFSIYLVYVACQWLKFRRFNFCNLSQTIGIESCLYTTLLNLTKMGIVFGRFVINHHQGYLQPSAL